MKRTTTTLLFAGTAVIAAAILALAPPGPGPAADTRSVIVQGDDLESVTRAVRDAGGTITHELGIIDAVAAELNSSQLAILERGYTALRIHENSALTAAAKGGSKGSNNSTEAQSEYSTTDDTEITETESTDSKSRNHVQIEFPALVSADLLQAKGITGRGVTVAVVDSGITNEWFLVATPTDEVRLLAHYDATTDTHVDTYAHSDTSGHGSHVSGVIVNSESSAKTDRFNGMAPDAGLVVVKAFDADGNGTYADVIRGIDWIVANKDRHAIRVLNLSFSAPAQSRYWDDPVNQAVMRAWESGVVVVVSAGNGGPEPMTVGVPGNVPYVITVGAITDGYTPDDRSDDRLTSFSAAGPTAEAFVKPDLLAPGGHIKSLMSYESRIAAEHPEFQAVSLYFTMSGTSQAAAVVTGIVALMLQLDPTLTPDDVKCRLMASAHPAVNPDGTLAYSVFQQGAGLVNAYDAVLSSVSDCANRGLDIARDLAGKEHYMGFARCNADGEYYIEGLEESSFLWNESTLWQESFLWSESTLWQESFLWNESLLWNESTLWQESFLWNESSLWNESTLWSESSLWSETALTSGSITINTWVDQE